MKDSKKREEKDLD
jgi:hypothetical protein